MIKICGNTRSQDLVKAGELGVDYVGFIFYRPSPRYISPLRAKEIIRQAEGQLKVGRPQKVGVFVNEKKEEIIKIARTISLDIIQLHGDESPALAHSLNLPFWKVLKIGETTTPKSLASLFSLYRSDTFLLDTFSQKKLHGGSGETFNWQIVTDYRKMHGPAPQCILAGGLNLDNIAKALTFSPAGFDLNSGLEDSPGVKNHRKMQALVEIIRNEGIDACS